MAGKWIKRASVVLLVVVVVAAALLVLLFGRAVRAAVETGGPSIIGVPTTLGGVRLGPIRGRLTLTDLVVGNPEGFQSDHSFRLGVLDLVVDTRSLFTDRILVRSVRITGPEITYEAGLGGSNIGRILDNLKPKDEGGDARSERPSGGQESAKKVEIQDLVVEGARVRVTVRGLGGHAVVIPLPPIHLTDIGKDTGGVSMREAVVRLLTALGDAVVGAVKGSGRLIGSGAKAVGSGAVDGAAKAVESVGELLKLDK